MVTDLNKLKATAEGGNPGAQFELALTLYEEGRSSEALSWLGKAAKAGSLDAITELGARLIVGAGAPRQETDGVNLLRLAAERNFGLAARYLAILSATGQSLLQSASDAIEWLVRASDAGDAQAARELQQLAGDGPSPSPSAADLGKQIQMERWTQRPNVRLLSSSPEIGLIEDFAPPSLCSSLISEAEGRLSQAGVTDNQTGRFVTDPARSNRYAHVRLFALSVPLALLREQMAAAIRQSSANFEVMNVLCYDVGERYDLHHDYLDPAEPGFQQEIAQQGQRVATFLVYLNDDYEGGETDFPDSGVRVRGRAGAGLYFLNTMPSGAIDPRTRHAGLPPVSGRKWLLSQWIRDRPQTIY